MSDEMCNGCVLKVDTGGDPWCNWSEKACYDIKKCNKYMSNDDYEKNEKCKKVMD